LKNLNEETKRKGPIFCGWDGNWKKELEKRLQTDEKITLTALGNVKNELLRYLNRRKDVQILKIETRYMKKREKGTGLKIIVGTRKLAETPKEKEEKTEAEKEALEVGRALLKELEFDARDAERLRKFAEQLKKKKAGDTS
jgi:hypothetical protein